MLLLYFVIVIFIVIVEAITIITIVIVIVIIIVTVTVICIVIIVVKVVVVDIVIVIVIIALISLIALIALIALIVLIALIALILMCSWLKLIKQAFVFAASSMEEEVELPPDVGDILLPLAVEEDECCDVAAAPPAVGSATLSQAAEEGGDCLLPPAVGEEDCDCFLPPAVDEECDDLVLPGDDCYNDLPGDVGLARAQRDLSQFGPPVGVMEIFCPPRLNAVAAEYRLRPGPSIDLLSGFDLSLPSTRAEVAYIQSRLKPRFLLTCAPCKLYSQLQAMWNVAKVPPEVMRYRKQKADELFNFGLESLERQEQWSGLGLHEHPAGATSWRDIDLNISRFFLIGYACTVFDFVCKDVLTLKDCLCESGLV